ncbi:MAG: EAL domain-containing protein [Solirubrobacteraceae bacterium]
MMESIVRALCMLDDAGCVSYMNPAAERLLGWSSAEVRGRTLHEVVHAGAHLVDECPIQVGHGAAGEAVSFEDDTFVRRDGAALSVSWVLTPVQTPDGKGSVIVITDTTSAGSAKPRLRGDAEQLEAAQRVREALVEQRFELFAQPIIDLRTAAVVAHELLLRLRERDGTTRAPGSFLAAARYSGAICELDRWVIGEAARLASAGHSVGFNVSADSLADPDLADDFVAAVSEHRADPARIVVELTETALMASETVAWTFIQRIRALGCEFALDDFGTGFGTFSHLKSLPIDYLKIDIGFVGDLCTSDASRHVVEAIVALARGFDQRTIAVGVEDHETLQTLRRIGVGYAQGYLLGRPAPLAVALESPAGGSRVTRGGDQRDLDDETVLKRSTGVRGRRSGDGVAESAARAFADALRVGDPHAAALVVDRAVGDGLTSVEIQSRVIAPAMRGIGELWERGAVTVAQEHLATAISHHVLARLYPGLLGQNRRRGERVVVAGVHGEYHALGLRMAADVFEGSGFEVRFLGADVPQGSLLALVAEHLPAIVALGVTMPLNAAMLIRSLRALRDRDVALRLVVGGQGVPIVLRHSAGVFYAADTQQLADYASTALDAPRQGEVPELAGGGVGFGAFLDRVPGLSGGLEARFSETAAAAADAARGHARRAVALEQIALRDPLTELWNRRAFDDRYHTLTDGPLTRPPAMLMIDVDHFKSVNDRFGHGVGDRALIGVARCISSALRPADFAARFGGDEFVVVLADTPLEVAAEIAERIRVQVEHDLTDPQLTVSIGLSVCGHADRRRWTLDADRALYEAKEHGRNQIAFTEP